jgi:hypothetical protein
MKRKLTLTIESGVTHRAKTFAHQQGISLSQFIEELLVRNIGETEKLSDKQSFSQRWAGKFQISEKTDARTVKLKEKYGLKSGK